MSSQASNSESTSFEQLDARVQRWIWSQGWASLRDIQEWAVPALVRADRDVIIAASTAAGKTEAAFFPILTHLCRCSNESGIVLYISPLKALINDQKDRLGRLCEYLDFPVTAWHGDITAGEKRRFLDSPKGILLITPESLEALFVNRGTALMSLFSTLRYIVVDELHAFIGSERGKQLQSLMQRVEYVAGHFIPRVGLSATLGDMSLAQAFLRPKKPQDVKLVRSTSSSQELLVQVRGYQESPVPRNDQAPEMADNATDEKASARISIAAHLYKVLRGSNNLIFPNSRQQVEWYADHLRILCARNGVINEFWPHHGSLSKELREDTECALKDGRQPASAICTNTLELGIDIGHIKSVAQIGCPPSVASLQQRLGRSGRRADEPAILRVYCSENVLNAKSSLSDQLRESLIQSIAMVRLLINKWFEPPRASGLHASTLVQQCLSSIAQWGGVHARQLWDILVNSDAFTNITQTDFTTLLKALGEKGLITQDASGLLLPGEIGERFINHYEFYSAFVSKEEFRLIQDGRSLGTVPIDKPLAIGQQIIFGGRRREVLQVDQEAKTIVVAAARGGQPPYFDGLGAQVHDRIRQEMQLVLTEEDVYPFLDGPAIGLLNEARAAFKALKLDTRGFLGSSNRTDLLTWRGDYINDTLSLLLNRFGIDCYAQGLVLEAMAAPKKIVQALENIAVLDSLPLETILKDVKNLVQEKWDWALPERLLMKSYASTHLDIAGAIQCANALLLREKKDR